jgi:hypothetical protein
MVGLQTINPVARAILVVAAVAGLVTAMTFAAMTSSATLTDNTISSATADLQVDSDEGGFASSDAGFDFTGLVPGAAYGAAQDFMLKNNGSVNLDVQVFAETVAATGTGVLDKTKVTVQFTNVSAGETVEYSLAQLESANRNVPGASSFFTDQSLEPGEIDTFTINVKLEDGAISGTGPVSVNDFDLVFVGTNTQEL